MLAQMYDNMLKPIMFGGRVLSEAEQRYATADKELLACYFAIRKYEIYVLPYDFIVYTDHKPLINLKDFKDVVNRRYRWIEYLENMSERLSHLKGWLAMCNRKLLDCIGVSVPSPMRVGYLCN